MTDTDRLQKLVVETQRLCKNGDCGTDISDRRPEAKFCCAKCRWAFWDRNNPRKRSNAIVEVSQ